VSASSGIIWGVIAASLTSSVSAQEWPVYGATNRNTKYSALSQVNRDNVGQLRVAWRWDSPDNAILRRRPGLETNLFQATPVLSGDRLYLTTSLHQVASVDARTGKTVWVYDPAVYLRGKPQRSGFVHRGVALWRESAERTRVFFGSADGYLTALDAVTGTPIEGFGVGGKVDLVQGLRRPVDRFQFGVNSPPIVVGDVVVVGSFIQDGWRSRRGPPGDVRGYDARTGALRWTFHTIPEAGEPGAETWLEDSWRYTGSANVWTYMSADDELGYLYLPISTPTNDYYGGHRPGDNLFAESVVCLDARTGKRIWHFQTTHHGIWDYDLPAGPVLAEVTIDGARRKILAQVSKQAFVYVLDRASGAPIWPIEERPVPQSTVAGERTAATQPFPTRPLPFDQQGLTVDDLIDFTPALRTAAISILRRYDSRGLFTPPSEQGTVILPGAGGGASWAGAALDPETGWLYVPSATGPNVVKLVAPEPGTSDLRFLSQRSGLAGPEGLPITKPPYGRITAIDLNTGDHRWVMPHGTGPRDHPLLQSLDLPPLGWPARGFVLTTATLLFAVQEPARAERYSRTDNVFEAIATTREPRLRAFDKRTGALLAEIGLPANAGGSPMTFAIGERQLIVVPVGGGGVRAELVALSIGGQ
jgi:quinoprotein glucose dehydrogenase